MPAPYPSPQDTAPLHLMKLCVGATSVEDLCGWQDSQRGRWPGGIAVHVTRMWPRRSDAVTGGGSLYWVIKGVILARQRIMALEPADGADGIRRCAIHLSSDVIRTEPAPRRPFQGWRYLEPDTAPRDLPHGRAFEPQLPADLARALADIGLR